MLPVTNKIHRRHSITVHTVLELAHLIGHFRCTEREACAKLDVPLKTWEGWKARAKNSSQLQGYLTRVSAEKIHSYVSTIETIGKAKDWRALAWLLERADPERFGDKRDVNVRVTSEPGPANLAVRNVFTKQAQAIDIQSTRALPAPK